MATNKRNRKPNRGGGSMQGGSGGGGQQSGGVRQRGESAKGTGGRQHPRQGGTVRRSKVKGVKGVK
jgi:hypothetical protein